MSAVIESKTNVAFSNTSSITFSAPSGIQNGNLLFAVIALESAGGSITTIPTGWTELRNEGRTNISTWIYYKLANNESGSYGWGWSGLGNRRNSGVMFRLSGVADTFVSATGTADNTASPSISNSITPTIADSLLFMIFSAEQNNNNVSGYAIATDNPTWTEQHDEVDASANFSLAVATAVRSATTATGNSSLTGGDTTADWVGHLVSVNLPISVTVTGSTGILTLTGNAGTVTGSANITGSTGVLTLNGNAGTVTTPDPLWINEDKPTTSTFTNETKP